MSGAVPIFGPLPYVALGAGLQTDYGIWIPPNTRCTLVSNNTASLLPDYQPLAQKFLPTLAAGLAECRAGAGDTVLLMPGHSESFTDNTILTNLVAGTRIIGIGNGAARPKLRITNTAGQFAFSKADVLVRNIHFALEGANGITKSILVTGADNVFDSCDFEVASGATAKSTIAFEIGTGGDRCRITNSVWRGTATHNVTDGIKVVAAVSDVCIAGNEMLFSATAANGLVHFTAAALSTKVLRNEMYNTHTASTACIAYDDVAVDGLACYNNMGVLSNGTASSQGITFGTSALVKAFQNFCSDEPKKSGLLAPTAAT